MVLTVVLYVLIPKGLFSTQDTGQLQARVETAQSVSYASHGRAAAGRLRAPDSGKTPMWTRCRPFIGVDAANNTMLHTGRMLINLKKAAHRQPAGNDGQAEAPLLARLPA